MVIIFENGNVVDMYVVTQHFENKY
jgi:hypothetical protein